MMKHGLDFTLSVIKSEFESQKLPQPPSVPTLH